MFTHFSGELWTEWDLSLHLITSSLIKGKHGHNAFGYLMLIRVDCHEAFRFSRFYSVVFKLALISIEKINQPLKTALNQISNTSKFVKNTLLRFFFQLSFRCLDVWLNTILAVFRGYIIKSLFKAANRFSVKQPVQDRIRCH